MNNALLYLGGILITVLAVLFAVPRFVDWNSYRGIFEEEASRVLGREVRVGGGVNLRLLPAPFVSFEKLRIADVGDDGGNSIIRVESFTMWLSVPPLLRGVLEAHRVELRRPIVNLALNAEGSGNWRSLTISPGAFPFAPREVALQSVAIHDGAVIVSNPSRGELARFDDINGELNADALDGPFKFKGETNWGGTPRHVRIATAKIDGKGDLRFKAAVNVSDSANSYVLDARLSDLSAVPTVEGDLTAKLNLGAAQSSATLAPQPPAAGDDLDLGLDDTPASPPAAAPSAQGTAPAPTAAAPPAGGATGFELKAKVKGTALGVALDDITVSLEAGTTPQLITGQAKFGWADKTQLDVDLASRWLDLDQLARTTEAKMPLDAVRSYFEVVASALPAEADTNARLEFDQLTLGGEPIGNVRLAASRSGGPLELKGVRADLPGGVRLELDGILTPAARVPNLDGTLFVSGKSLTRFLSWGLGTTNVARERGDGAFSLDGRFALGDGTLALTDATADFSGTPLEGSLKLDLGERRKLAVAIEGQRIDVAQFGSGLVDLGNLRRILFGTDAPATAGGDTPPAASDAGTAPFDPAGGDLSLELKVAELIDGEHRLKDVDADIRLERGRLSIPRLRFATVEGLYVEAEGEATDVPARPKGVVRGLISAPDARAARALVTLLDVEGAPIEDVARIAGLAPFRLAGTLQLSGDASNANTLAVDGTLGGGRLTAALRLDGGRAQWRTSSLDLQATIDSPDVAQLVATLFDANIKSSGSEPAKSGRAVIKAAGVPAERLLSYADVTAEGLSLGYRGEIRLPEPGKPGVDGELKIVSSDARIALALAGLSVADGASGVPLNGSVDVRHKDGILKLESDATVLGDSTISGQVSIVAGNGGRKTIDATLTADKASFTALLAPLLGAPEGAGALDAAAPTPAPPPRSAPEPEAPAIIWPEQAFDLALLDRADGKIALTVGSLSLEPGLAIGNAQLAAELSQDAIKVTRLEGNAVGGRLTSELDITRERAGIGLKGTIRIDVSSKPVPPSGAGADGAPQPGDAVAFHATFSSRALSPAAVMAALTGSGQVTVGNATLNGNSPTAVSEVARAALTGQGPSGGAQLAEAVKAALKDGEVKLGKIAIPVEISDGALKLKKVQIDMAEGRSTFVTAVELQTMQIDSEWQIEPKLDKKLTANPTRALLPPVTVVYAGKLSELASLEPQISADALERELVVRKMELDVGELERLRKLDEERARQDAARRKAADEERARLEAERRKALEEDQAPPPGTEPNAVEREELTAPPGASPSDIYDNSVMDAPAGVPIERDIEATAPPPVVAPSPTSQRPPPRRKRPADEAWRPFQSTPY
ncbi:AsmA family protein [Hyphomicrobium sp.]|uniref:AsmA family protein n=1 Tax=Hyphomicrobium sp. TaxID=82 RepID=UPI0025BD4B3F|nr:AsmA family protein [Hyphomicrobium sp.]MCC7252646.1 AsmA family protein [Hyphomicrobium sp.]